MTDVKDKLPDNDVWVLGRCKLKYNILSDSPIVYFQVKHNHFGWADWCYDLAYCNDEEGWEVIAWEPLPEDR